MAAVETTAKRSTSPALSIALDRNGRAELAEGGTVYRPTRDSEPVKEPSPPPGQLSRLEQRAIADAAAPLATLEKELADTLAHIAELRYSQDPAERKLVPDLVARADALKDEQPNLRANLRLAILTAIKGSPGAGFDSLGARALQQHAVVVDTVADSAARVQGVFDLVDEWLNAGPWNSFDSFGHWATATLPAPPGHLLPKGRNVTPDAHGRSCLWSASSPAHAEAVRRVKVLLREQIEAALGPCSWPF